MVSIVASVMMAWCPRLGRALSSAHNHRRETRRILVRSWATEGVVRRLPGLEGMALKDSASECRVGVWSKSVDRLRWYACGPTVYDAAHVGHARTYVTLDMLVRVARIYGGAEVEYAMGVTDIDDKIIGRAVELGVSPLELARTEEHAFFADMDALGCQRPNRVLRVTEHLAEILAFIADIEAEGLAYEAEGSVWFDVNQLGDLYGIFTEGKGTSAAAAAAAETTPAESVKRDPRDFALWKAAKPGEPSWESKWGPGRPGWHIECSAMTRAAFGDYLDLHAGGIDLAFPHHENEVAQWRGARCASVRGETWCSCWFHTGHVHIEGRKMSKSLKNFITVREMLESNHADDFRLFCALHRYRSTVSYTKERLEEASRVRNELRAALLAAKDALRDKPSDAKKFGASEVDLASAAANARADVRAALLDDLDTPTAMAALVKLATRVRQYVLSSDSVVSEALLDAASSLSDALRHLGLEATARAWVGGGVEAPVDATPVEDALSAFVELRSEVRSAALAAPRTEALRADVLDICDRARDADALKRLGFVVVDSPSGSSLGRRAVVVERPTDDDRDADEPPRQREDKFAEVRKIPPELLFREAEEYRGKFGTFDEDGLPRTDAEGATISKSMRKKLRKRLEVHAAKWAGAC